MKDTNEEGPSLVEDNPLVDVAAYLFLEDIADKQGASGMNTYLISLATSLAKSMPEEEYASWDDFLEALRKGESIMSSFEVVKTRTENWTVPTNSSRPRSPFLRRFQPFHGWNRFANSSSEPLAKSWNAET